MPWACLCSAWLSTPLHGPPPPYLAHSLPSPHPFSMISVHTRPTDGVPRTDLVGAKASNVQTVRLAGHSPRAVEDRALVCKVRLSRAVAAARKERPLRRCLLGTEVMFGVVEPVDVRTHDLIVHEARDEERIRPVAEDVHRVPDLPDLVDKHARELRSTRTATRAGGIIIGAQRPHSLDGLRASDGPPSPAA